MKYQRNEHGYDVDETEPSDSDTESDDPDDEDIIEDEVISLLKFQNDNYAGGEHVFITKDRRVIKAAQAEWQPS